MRQQQVMRQQQLCVFARRTSESSVSGRSQNRTRVCCVFARHAERNLLEVVDYIFSPPAQSLVVVYRGEIITAIRLNEWPLVGKGGKGHCVNNSSPPRNGLFSDLDMCSHSVNHEIRGCNPQRRSAGRQTENDTQHDKP